MDTFYKASHTKRNVLMSDSEPNSATLVNHSESEVQSSASLQKAG